MWKICDRFLEKLCAIFAAFSCAQVPEFLQQYGQRLAGHVAELKRTVGLFQQSARLAGKPLDLYIQKFVANSDPDIASQGTLMQGMVDRLQVLDAGLHALEQAPWYAKPFVFITHVEPSTAYATFESFQPALSITGEGIVYAFVGMMIGFSLYALIRYLFVSSWKFLRRSWRRKQPRTVN